MRPPPAGTHPHRHLLRLRTRPAIPFEGRPVVHETRRSPLDAGNGPLVLAAIHHYAMGLGQNPGVLAPGVPGSGYGDPGPDRTVRRWMPGAPSTVEQGVRTPAALERQVSYRFGP